MTCRLRHRWDGWHFSLCSGCHEVDDTVVWRMCRRCGAYQEHESATSVSSDWLLRRKRRTP